MSFARGWSCSPIPTAAWNTSSASCAGRSTTRSPRSARLTIANWRSRTWKARWPRPRKPRLRRAPQQPRPPPSAVPRDATSGICPGAWNASNTSSNRTARSVPAGAGTWCASARTAPSGWTSCRRNCGSSSRCARSTPAAPARQGVIQAAAPAHLIDRRAADRGGAGAGARFQVRRSSSAVPSIADLRPLGRGPCTAPRSPAGWARRRFI